MAKNYLAAARTLMESVAKLHSGVTCYVLVVDDFDGFINPEVEAFETIKLGDLRIANQAAFCFKYDITELCTAAKPYFLQMLLHERQVDQLVYLDPDIYVTNPLDFLFDRLGTNAVVLTPHTTVDYPNDGKYPDDTTVYATGLMNLGFIGVNASGNAARFLEWWKHKLDEKCVVDRSRGYFFDQKFIDFALLLFDDIYVEKGVGYNVAFWNVHARTIGTRNGAYVCNDDLLSFFHFSGYKPGQPDTIENYFGASSRYDLKSRPDLRPLFSEYRTRLLANGWDETSRWPYSYASFKTGIAIPYSLRALYRSMGKEALQYGDPFASSELEGRIREEQGSRFLSSLLVWGFEQRYFRYIYRRWIKPSRAGRRLSDRLWNAGPGRTTSGNVKAGER